MKTQQIALMDMDGTLCDYDAALTKDLQLLGEPEEIVPNFYGPLAPHYSARIDLVRRQPGWWEGLDPSPLGMRIYRKLQEKDFEIHILTKGPSSKSRAWMEKVNWCRQWVPDALITITEDKGLVYGKILVDDYPGYVERWLQWRPRGLVLMPANPGNATYEHENVMRVFDDSSDDFIDHYIDLAFNRRSGEKQEWQKVS
tara:strand:+ start:1133 stop:1729 length:597 start_codon:yes stop_codon:yes gene_type:complete